jgi:lipopolysaccharide export system permease protein
LLEDVTIKRFFNDGAESIEHAEQLEWQSFLTSAQMDILLLPPESLPSADLYHYIGHLRSSGMDPLRYELALWQKISLPLKIGIMVLLGISFVFGSVRSVAISQRVLAGAVVAILFYLVERMSGYVGLLYRFNPILTAIVPAALLLIAAVWRFRQIR